MNYQPTIVIRKVHISYLKVLNALYFIKPQDIGSTFFKTKNIEYSQTCYFHNFRLTQKEKFWKPLNSLIASNQILKQAENRKLGKTTKTCLSGLRQHFREHLSISPHSFHRSRPPRGVAETRTELQTTSPNSDKISTTRGHRRTAWPVIFFCQKNRMSKGRPKPTKETGFNTPCHRSKQLSCLKIVGGGRRQFTRNNFILRILFGAPIESFSINLHLLQPSWSIMKIWLEV